MYYNNILHTLPFPQVRSPEQFPMSPPYGILSPAGATATTAPVTHSLPASPILPRHRPHPAECNDGFRSLPRPPQRRKISAADEVDICVCQKEQYRISTVNIAQ